jgi:hypothetical protein
MSTSTDDDTSEGIEPTADLPAASRRHPGRRVAEVGVVVLALVAVALVGISRFAPDSDDGFCDQVAALPSLRTDAATPTAELATYAEGLDRVAAAAGDDRVATAATTIADYQQRLASAIGTGPSSVELLDDVESIDTTDLVEARTTLDRAIERRCS